LVDKLHYVMFCTHGSKQQNNNVTVPYTFMYVSMSGSGVIPASFSLLITSFMISGLQKQSLVLVVGVTDYRDQFVD
jgi:hypothetical protein